MIEAWQVWLVDFDPVEGHEQAGKRPAVVVSSEFHLQVTGGRMVTVAPLTSSDRRTLYRPSVLNHQGERNWVLVDQIRTVSTSRFIRATPWWVLKDDEVRRVVHSLRNMVDF